MKFYSVIFAVFFFCVILAPVAADAGCTKKAAEATSGSEDSAKWFVMETIVQQVSWGLWPGWVLTGDLPGYSIKNKKFRCKKGSFGVTCYGQATICSK